MRPRKSLGALAIAAGLLLFVGGVESAEAQRVRGRAARTQRAQPVSQSQPARASTRPESRARPTQSSGMPTRPRVVLDTAYYVGKERKHLRETYDLFHVPHELRTKNFIDLFQPRTWATMPWAKLWIGTVRALMPANQAKIARAFQNPEKRQNLQDAAGGRALRLDGPFGPNGPFQEKGPIGNDAAHASSHVHNMTRMFDLPMQRAVANAAGYASASGPESIETVRWRSRDKLSFFGPLDAAGKDGALSNKGPLGYLGRVRGSLVRKPGGIWVHPKTGKRVMDIDVPVDHFGKLRVESIYERYTVETARALSSATRKNLHTIAVHGHRIDLGKNNHLGTSFMIEDAKLDKVRARSGQKSMTDLTLHLRSGNKPELVSFFVAPERQGSKPVRNLGLEIRFKDETGKEHAHVSRFRNHINMQKLYLPAGTTVKVRVFSLTRKAHLEATPKGYTEKFRFFATSNTTFDKSTLAASAYAQ